MGRAERDTVRRALVERAGGLVDEVLAGVRDEVPVYRALHASQLAEVRFIVEWTVVRTLHNWVEETTFRAEDVERARAIGRARAADGRSISAVVKAYHAGAAVLGRLIAETAGDRLEIDDVFLLNRVWLSDLDLLTDALSAGHADGVSYLGADQQRARRAFLEDLLKGRHASPGVISDRSRMLGITLPADPVLLVADGGGEVPPGVLSTVRAGQLIVVLDPARTAEAGQALAQLETRGAFVSGFDLGELATAYHVAHEALELAPPEAFHRGVLSCPSTQVVALLNAVPGVTPAMVRRQVLGSLLEPDHRHLAETLDAYLVTGLATAAAEALHVHPQTLRYRMRQIRDLTGLDPQDSWHRLMLGVAHSIHG